jgi:hypothetical protein
MNPVLCTLIGAVALATWLLFSYCLGKLLCEDRYLSPVVSGIFVQAILGVVGLACWVIGCAVMHVWVGGK